MDIRGGLSLSLSLIACKLEYGRQCWRERDSTKNSSDAKAMKLIDALSLEVFIQGETVKN